MSRVPIVLIFLISQTSLFFQNAANQATAGRIYGPMNWVCVVLMSMGKISFVPLNILSTV